MFARNTTSAVSAGMTTNALDRRDGKLADLGPDSKSATAIEARKPEVSRAAAAAQRRMSASAARRRTVSEVLLLTSSGFPSQQYQELLNFIKGMQLPPDVSQPDSTPSTTARSHPPTASG